MEEKQFIQKLKNLQEEIRNQMRDVLTKGKEETHKIRHLAEIYDAINRYFYCTAEDIKEDFEGFDKDD
jgi:hypothetical protein